MLIRKLKKILWTLFIVLVLCSTLLFFKTHFAAWLIAAKHRDFTVIPAGDHNATKTDQDIGHLLQRLNSREVQALSFEEKVAFAARYFENRPSRLTHIEGEGDLCPGSIDHHGCPHLQEDPIYRTDFFACNTLIQIVLASLYSNNLQAFKRLILKVEYGAAHESFRSIHYYNRNNFISGDFNPVNEKHGLIEDATQSIPFADAVKTIEGTIDRRTWFTQQLAKDSVNQTVRVLSAQGGVSMLWRATQYYPQRVHSFRPQKISLDYIPKEVLIRHSSPQGTYFADEEKINQLSTPAIVEIVRDPSKWKLDGKNLGEVIGSDIIVSHVGLIYHQSFRQGETIYQKISCSKQKNEKVCRVIPVVCKATEGCQKVMLTHATFAYPEGYAYYQDQQGTFHCDPLPKVGISFEACNRVMSLPLAEYLMMYQYGHYIFMEENSFLGIHIEKILER